MPGTYTFLVSCLAGTAWELLGVEQALREICFGVFQLGKLGARVWRLEARDSLVDLGMARFPGEGRFFFFAHYCKLVGVNRLCAPDPGRIS